MRMVIRALLALVVVLTVVFAVLVVASQPVPEHPFFAGDRLLVIAHQGGDGLRPSNTLAAFEHAVELGVDVLEMDIHSTSDGALVVIHDDTVDRTTDGTGRVQDFTLEALQALDAGYDWPTLAEESHRTDRPYRGQGIIIPTLDSVMAAFPDMPMNIEIKQREPSIAGALCQMIRDYSRADRTLVASFHQQSRDEFRQTCPEVPVSAVEGDVRTFYILSSLGLSAAFQPSFYAFQIPEASGGLQLVTRGFVVNAQRHNIDVHVWTVNDETGMRRMIDHGVNGIITDYPDKLLNLLDR